MGIDFPGCGMQEFMLQCIFSGTNGNPVAARLAYRQCGSIAAWRGMFRVDLNQPVERIAQG